METMFAKNSSRNVNKISCYFLVHLRVYMPHLLASHSKNTSSPYRVIARIFKYFFYLKNPDFVILSFFCIADQTGAITKLPMAVMHVAVAVPLLVICRNFCASHRPADNIMPMRKHLQTTVICFHCRNFLFSVMFRKQTAKLSVLPVVNHYYYYLCVISFFFFFFGKLN